MSRLLCNNSTQRKCVKCKEIKLLNSNNYHKDKNRPFGFMYKCIECERKRVDNRTWEQKKAGMSETSKEKQRKAKEAYRKTPIGRAHHTAKSYEINDLKKGLFSELTKYDILAVYDKKCSYCGYPATGYDRVDNSKGHLKTNCIPCCGDCNTAKMDHFSYDEMMIIGKAIREVKDMRLKRLN